MSSRARAALLLALAAFWPRPAAGQFGLSNLLEVRVGKDPDDPLPDVPESRLSRFDQLSVDYTQARIRLGFRHESYVPSNGAYEFSTFTRRYAEWRRDPIEALVGNYEALFGRGLVLRAFELPGVVREEIATPQFGDARDLDGVRVRARYGRLDLLALQGKPRRADEPPDVERRGTVAGASAAVQVAPGVRAGAHHLRLDQQVPGAGSTPEASAGFAQLGLDAYLERAGLERLSLDTYVEYARVTGLAVPVAVSSPRSQPDRGYGVYVAQGLYVRDAAPGLGCGLSYEYKDYQNFELGVNEPPTLVREHSFVLLNRSTHVLVPLQELGSQVEARFDYRGWVDLALNWSRAENAGSRRFREFYAELSGHVRGATLTAFADTQQDEVESIVDRDTYGGYALVPVGGGHSLEVQVERQRAERGERARVRFADRYLGLTYAYAGRLSLAYVHQTTDDPDEAEDPVTGAVSRRPYDALQARLSLGGHHEIVALWGRRRGGLACTAGTCYKVRAFDGVLAQLVSRF